MEIERHNEGRGKNGHISSFHVEDNKIGYVCKLRLVALP